MAQKYTPIWDDWLTVTRELTPAEKGRLIDAIVAYDNGGNWQELINGNERYVFPGYQVRLDLWKGLSETRAKAAKGIRTEQNEATVSKTEQNETKGDKTPKVKVKEEVNNIITTRTREDDTMFGAITVDPLVIKVQQELNGLTDTHYSALDDYRRELGDELVSYAIDISVGNGVRNWNYVESILRGWLTLHIHTVGEAKAESERHKKQQQAPVQRGGKVVGAQQYHQRDYNEDKLADELGVSDLFKEGAG